MIHTPQALYLLQGEMLFKMIECDIKSSLFWNIMALLNFSIWDVSYKLENDKIREQKGVRFQIHCVTGFRFQGPLCHKRTK